MDGTVFWEMFLDTGSPEAYVLYRLCCPEKGNYREEKVDHISVCPCDAVGSGYIGI